MTVYDFCNGRLLVPFSLFGSPLSSGKTLRLYIVPLDLKPFFYFLYG